MVPALKFLISPGLKSDILHGKTRIHLTPAIKKAIRSVNPATSRFNAYHVAVVLKYDIIPGLSMQVKFYFFFGFNGIFLPLKP